MINWNKNLKKLMNLKGISVTTLSKSLNIPIANIYRILNGESKNPRKSNLKKIANYFNITYEDLISSTIDWGNIEGYLDIVLNTTRRIRICQWRLDEKGQLQQTNEVGNTLTISAYKEDWSFNTFCLKVENRYMNYFIEGDLIVCDIDISPKNGSFVLINICNMLLFKQYLVDERGTFLKTLDKNFGAQGVYNVDKNVKVFATIVQLYRNF